ncbi:MAG: tetratricopeptide repeat protein [Planctomycetes bacterium]|nr:tetratricopeptide repeat protein [Planctomycetota bacterium]
MARGDTTAAIESFRRLVKRDPRSFEANYNLGTVLLRVDAATEAVGFLEEAVRLRPDDRNAAINLGCALLRAQRAGEALETFLRIARQFPGDVEATVTAAKILVHTAFEDGAREVLARAVGVNRAGLEALGPQVGRFGEILREALESNGSASRPSGSTETATSRPSMPR